MSAQGRHDTHRSAAHEATRALHAAYAPHALQAGGRAMSCALAATVVANAVANAVINAVANAVANAPKHAPAGRTRRAGAAS